MNDQIRTTLNRGVVIPAHPLALNASRKLDERRQRALSRYYIAAGSGGLAVGVHTTQFAIRDPNVGLFEPVLRIAKQGSMEAGGRMINCATNDGGDPKSTRWPAGHVMVDNVYATYQYPAELRHPDPILFNSGGGHTARVYDTTPDGREGWLTLFLREGFAV